MGGLIQIRSPIECILGLLDHFASHCDELRHDAILYQSEYSMVIVIFLRGKQAWIPAGLSLFLLAQENAGRCDTCRFVMLQYFTDMCSCVALLQGFRSVGCRHGCRRGIIHVDCMPAQGLRPREQKYGKTNECYDFTHHDFSCL